MAPKIPHELNEGLVEALTAALIDKGLFIELGFLTLRWKAWPEAPPAMVQEMRMAFFAGAQHVFHGVLNVLGESKDEVADFHRMDQVDAELRRFIDDFQSRFLKTEGSA